jgi:hypothetical protein
LLAVTASATDTAAPDRREPGSDFVTIKGAYAMRNHRSTMLWMKDLIEHMNRCHEQLQWADTRTQSFLTDSMLTDLMECQRLCHELRGNGRPQVPVAATA